jgi:hypothetical protein
MRSRERGLRGDRLAPTLGCAGDELEERRAASRLAQCQPALQQSLMPLAEEAGHFMTVTDAAGLVMWQYGPAALLEHADEHQLVPGADWSEASVGTNGIGTAVALEQPVQIFGAEHFIAALHPWCCSAAPIKSMLSDGPIGFVVLTGPAGMAHPLSLQLACAGARLAAAEVDRVAQLCDERLRGAFLEHVAGRRRPLALLSADGRVLEARSGARMPHRLALPVEGSVELPGRSVEAEPLDGGRGWILWDGTGTSRRAVAPARIQLSLLGGSPSLCIDAGPRIGLRLRHAEILAILALHRGGLTPEQLSEQLFGTDRAATTTRAEISRLRRLLGRSLTRSPYRLDGALAADALDSDVALRRGDTGAALRIYHAPLLPHSVAPGIERWRDELEGALRQAVLRGRIEHLLSWVASPSGRDDLEALILAEARMPPSDPRIAMLQTQARDVRHRLQRRL